MNEIKLPDDFDPSELTESDNDFDEEGILEEDDLKEPDQEDLKSPEPHKPTNISQEILVSYLVNNYDAWVLAAPIIKANYFSRPYDSVVEYVLEHTNRYEQMPSPAIIRMKTGVELVRPDDVMDERTLQWLLDEVEQFCSLEAMRLEIIDAAEKISDHKNKPDRSVMVGIVDSIKKVADMSIHRDLGIEVHEDVAKRLTDEDDIEQTKSGYRHLDLVTNGGPPMPGLVMLAGKSGLGKSVFLSNFAINYAERGYDVMYVSLELSEKRLHRRMLSMMSGIPIREIRMQAEQAEQTIQNRLKVGEGTIWIKKMRMTGTTTTDLNAYHKELWMRAGKKPRIMCLDYFDRLSPKTKGIKPGDLHVKDMYTGTELYDFLTETGMLCFTASQLIKQSEDMSDPNQSILAGGTPKVDVSDLVALIRRNFEQNMASLYILKGRDGGDGRKVPLLWNPQTLRITDAPEEFFLEANPSYDPRFLGRTTSPQAKNRPVNTPSFSSERILERLGKSLATEVQPGFDPMGLSQQ